MTKLTPPKKLYKYRTFSVNTLRLLTEAEIYYAPPAQLNDPLDCKPTIEDDTDRESLEKLYYKMLKESHDKNLKATHDAYTTMLKIVDSKLPETNNSKEYVLKQINEHRYYSTQYGNYNDGQEGEAYYRECLIGVIKKILYDEIGKKGVLSLSEKWDCPLMWSHYADQHYGLCIEYDMTEHDCKNIKAVNYSQPRSIKISDIIAWKKNSSTDAENTILNTFFYSKARQWKYEKEWRDINESGVNSAPFKISAIYFGFRCDESVRTSIGKLLAGKPIKFYDITTPNKSFDLKRRIIDKCEIEEWSLKEPDFERSKFMSEGIFSDEEPDV